MAKILTIPKEILKKGDLVLIPRKEYEELLKLKKKRQWEEKDTEEAIRVFKEEKKKNKLRKINSLVELE
jgi:phage pi2 protein 07